MNSKQVLQHRRQERKAYLDQLRNAHKKIESLTNHSPLQDGSTIEELKNARINKLHNLMIIEPHFSLEIREFPRKADKAENIDHLSLVSLTQEWLFSHCYEKNKVKYKGDLTDRKKWVLKVLRENHILNTQILRETGNDAAEISSEDFFVTHCAYKMVDQVLALNTYTKDTRRHLVDLTRNLVRFIYRQVYGKGFVFEEHPPYYVVDREKSKQGRVRKKIPVGLIEMSSLFDDLEKRALEEISSDNYGVRNLLLIRFVFSLGYKLSIPKILELKWSHINLEKNRVEWDEGSLHVPKHLFDLLCAYRGKQQGHLFKTNPGRSITQDQINKIIQAITKDFTPESIAISYPYILRMEGFAQYLSMA